MHFIPALATILLHMIVVILAGWGWNAEPTLPLRKPEIKSINAQLVDIKQLQAYKEKQEAERRKKQLEQQRALDEKARKERERQEQVRKEKERKEQALKDKAKKDKERKEKALKEQALKDKAKKDKERKERERAEQIRKENERKKQELAQQEKLEKERLLKQREAEAAKQALAAAVDDEDEFLQAQNDALMAQSYMGVIQQAVKRNWTRPPSARREMEVVLILQLIPTGEVISVSVLKSSGNAAFDRSAVNAVNKAHRFPELQKLDIRVFDVYFRRFNMIFRPEDLRT